jgi:hypothetical protein
LYTVDGWDALASAEFVGYNVFYDIHVPGLENYVAEGITNHNSGKTMGQATSLIVHGLELAQFRAFALAPLSIQAQEVYDLIMNMIADTEFEKRFLIKAPTKPFPKIFFGYQDVGICRIECYPIAGKETKLRTLTGDCAIIDQAEHEQIDLREALRSIGTRFRGRVAKNGRERLGTLTLVANSGDKQELWDIYDEAESDPKNYLSINPSSYDNPYLTDADLQRFELQVGGSAEAKSMFMFGKRPLGNGQHFSRQTLENMRDKSLDDMMSRGLARQEATGDDYGFVKLEGKNVGTFEWLLPPIEGREYMVMSDPGTKDPPGRDSAVIMVWDITDFPGDVRQPKPAALVGFVWVYGGNKITTWANRFAEMVHRYKAIGKCGFDATGYQSGYDQWMNVLNQLFVEKISLAGNNKALCLNAAKMLTAREMLRTPAAVTHLYQQLARYEYPPEPKRLRQDIVMAFIMSAWWMQRLFYLNEEPLNERPGFDPDDRYPVEMENRYGEHRR